MRIRYPSTVKYMKITQIRKCRKLKSIYITYCIINYISNYWRLYVYNKQHIIVKQTEAKVTL